jgi:enamine deaminase RidA (YjgF/YER057c/UK114 family)
VSLEERLASLGLSLPPVPKPAATYVAAVRTGNLVFTAGQVPFVDGRLPWTGRVDGEVSQDDAYQAARIAVLNALAAVGSVTDLDAIERIVRLTGYVNSSGGFVGQPAVVNGASDLLVELFGEAGKHSRTAVGVYQLPLGSSVEIDLIAQIRA